MKSLDGSGSGGGRMVTIIFSVCVVSYFLLCSSTIYIECVVLVSNGIHG